MNSDYYAQKLSAQRLRRVYAIAGPRVRRYLRAEIDHLAQWVRPGDRVLELGCGYGRVLAPLAAIAGTGWGVDHALDSLRLAKNEHPQLHLATMDAGRLGFAGGSFDLVLGIQNFISACGLPPAQLLAEGLRVTRPGGRLVLSSYTPQFWPHRLAWFRQQAAQGLLGPIDEVATGDGVIVCSDGFRATTFTSDDFSRLARSVGDEAGVAAKIYSVDNSSLFCEIVASP